MAPSTARLVALLGAVLTISCPASRRQDEPLAGPSPGAPLPAGIERVLALPTLAPALVAARPLEAIEHGYRSISATAQGARLDVALPDRASGALRLSLRGHPAFWAEITADDLVAARPSWVKNVLAYPRILPQTDVFHLATFDGAEEIRVVHSAGAPRDARYIVRTGPEVAEVRVREGRIELVDASGRVGIASAPLTAIDAQRTERALSATVTGGGARHVVTTTLDAIGLEFPIAVDPAWTSIEPMKTARQSHASLYLPTQRKLFVFGGKTDLSSTGSISTAELYDVATNTWSAAADMPVTTNAPTPGALLASGKAMSAFGAVTIVYDPLRNAWTKGVSMNDPRQQPSLTALADGRALMAGGQKNVGGVATSFSTAEVYDATRDAWTRVGAMSAARTSHTASLLGSGKVLLAGGAILDSAGNVALSGADLFDPTSNTWTPAASMHQKRSGHAAVVLAGGSVLVAGGSADGLFLSTAELYDPAADTWTVVSPLPNPRRVRAVLLTTGQALLAGDLFVTDTRLFDPTTRTFAPAGHEASSLNAFALTAIPGGHALLTGGAPSLDAPSTTTVELYALVSAGGACTGTYECAAGFCTDGVCCDAASCPSGSSCSTAKAGTCAKLAGVACTASSECASSLCVDGVCCDRACTGTCEACDVIGSTGTCKPVNGAAHGTRACSDGGGDVCKATACDGVDPAACHRAPAGTVVCGASACTKGIETHQGLCDASGACPTVPKSCGLYACGASACKTTCASKDDCVGGYYCDTAKSACLPVVGLGKACIDTGWCGAGLSCVDGVCCGSASCDVGSTCAFAGREGTCIATTKSKCALDAQCGSGHCVDGVCCESSCGDQCAACDVAESIGKCTPVVGAPHGTRATCAADSSNVCGASACDGTTTTACAGKVGAETKCRAAACAEGVSTVPAVCDGKGNCPAVSTVSCNGFACDDKAVACKTSCAGDGDCAVGFVCESSTCKPITDKCSPDGTAAIHADGVSQACAPFLCRAGRCLTSCATTSDCAVGTACAASTKTCESIATTPVSGGGCSSTANAPVGASGSIVLLLVVLSATALRRRRGGGARRLHALVVAAIAIDGASCKASSETGRPGLSDTRAPALTIVAAAGALAPTPDLHLERTASGLRLPTLSRPGAADRLRATIPLRADGALRLDVADGVWLEVTSLDAQPRVADISGSAVVFEDVAADTSLVHAMHPAGVEVLRILRSPSAPAVARYRVRHGPALASVRVREGRIEAVDAHGVVRIASAPIFAIDARFVRRDVHVTMRDDVVVEALDPTGLAYPIVVDPLWTAGASLRTARIAPAVLLPSGKVMIVGGTGGDATATSTMPFSTAEIYDPTSNTWSDAAPMHSARTSPVAVVAGKVIVVGGSDTTGSAISSAESYDPTTNVWTLLPDMPSARDSFSIAALPSGKVLVFGGNVGSDPAYSSALVYDTSTRVWSSVGAMSVGRLGMTTAVLSGKVLTAGGWSGIGVATAPYSTAELFDPTTNTWSPTKPMVQGRADAPAVTLADDRVLVSGGDNPGRFSGFTSAEIYDPITNAWTATPPPPTGRLGHSLTLLASGKVLIAGGNSNGVEGLTTAELFDPKASTWSSAGSMPDARYYHDGVPIFGGTGVLIAGGADGIAVVALSTTSVFRPLADGSACKLAVECASGFCTDGACCSVATCGVGSTCGGATKPGTCAKVNGVPCTTSAECGSGHCVDAFCCVSACDGQCGACDVPGNLGKCWPVKGNPHRSRPMCAGAGAGAGCASTCDGKSVAACSFPAAGAPCSGAACSEGLESHVGTCDGAGKCSDVASSCGAYGCGAARCNTACSSSLDCAAGYTCTGGACLPLLGLGASCASSAECAVGLFCTDGVCCGSAACAAGSSCSTEAKKGECRKLTGAGCDADAQCGTGHCVDRHCCDGTCTGSCEACDVPDKLGLCSPIAGKPRAAHPACASDPTTPCAATECDGSDRVRCASRVGSGVSCRAQSCTDGMLTAPASCDGKGACPAAITTSCQGYVCDASASACRTSCRASDDCTAGFVCQDAKCTRLSGVCSADGLSLVDTAGATQTCAPYFCVGNLCRSDCDTSADCIQGWACDGAHRCNPSNAPVPSTGGCSVRITGGEGGGESESPGLELAALALCALGTARRRAAARS